MSFWETITGSDLTSQWHRFDARARALPADHQAAREQITVHLYPYADFTGRNLTPILDAALSLLEEAAADGQSAHEVFGDDIAGFCTALAGGAGARTYRDRWREQLNSNVARKLGRLGG
jgi:DNA-binding ferritin-like protein (Dps family)